MMRLDDVINWLLLIGLTAAGVFIAFYFVMFLLPFIILSVIGYGAYVSVKLWLRRRRMSAHGQSFEIHREERSSPVIIDAEFEVLDEKNHK